MIYNYVHFTLYYLQKVGISRILAGTFQHEHCADRHKFRLWRPARGTCMFSHLRRGYKSQLTIQTHLLEPLNLPERSKLLQILWPKNSNTQNIKLSVMRLVPATQIYMTKDHSYTGI